MMRSAAQRSRLAASTLLACRVLVIVLGLLDLVSTLATPRFGPVVMVLAGMAFVSVIAATRRAGWGVALAAVPIAADPFFPHTVTGALPMLVTAASAAVTWRLRPLLVLALAYAAVIGVDAALVGIPVRTAMLAVDVLVGLAVGWGLRVLLRRAREGEERIATLEHRVAEVRRDERASLADELSVLLVDDLAASAASLDRGLPEGDTGALASTLEVVEERSRASLARLRQLVSTLRSPDQAEPGTPLDLVEGVEEVEDVLVGHGHPVDLAIAGIPAHVATQPAALLLECLRAAAEHARAHAPAGGSCTMGVAGSAQALELRVAHDLRPGTTPEASMTGLRRAIEGIRARGGSVEVRTGDRWELIATIPLRTEQRPMLDPATGSRFLRLPAILGRIALTVSALVGLALEGPQTLTLMLGGAPGWPTSTLWSLLWLGLALAGWSARAAALLLAGGLAGGLAVWTGTAAGLALVPQVLLTGALTGVLVAHRPRWLLACFIGWAVYLPLWSRGEMDAATWVAALIFPCFGGLVGLTVHHFSGARAAQLAELERLGVEHAQARAQERRQLAGELHDIVAHQLSLISLQVMAQRGASDATALPTTAEQVAAITASARADLTTLVTVMRAHHEGAAADRAEAGQATWLTPPHATEGAAVTLSEAGYPVAATAPTDLDRCDPTLARTVARILREATTNILRHAPVGSPCTIAVTDRDGAVEVIVTSTLPDAPLSSPLSTGFGLLGLQERVTLTGGTFSAGPEGGQWVVRARVPHQEAARSPRSGAQRGQRVGVDDAELDRANEHLRPRPHPQLVGHPRQVLLH